MKNKIIPLLTPVLLSGFWGIFTYLLGAFILTQFPLTSLLYYPILFGGITLIIAITLESEIPFSRALIVGLISGFIYQILSPIFPFLSSILAGVSLGGGLIVDEGKLGDVFNRLFSILKGIFLFPVFVYTGGLVAGITNSIFDSDFFLWLFWGAWIGLGICLISIPIFKTDDTEQDFQTLSEVDEFKSEAQQILSELNQLDSKFS
ncbi:MAG: hypothetical protein HYW01_12815 [Deltaproteobacteria bacterium]|nr:hypothetical protein [Deltaproteobacteria bacterium]